MPCWRNRDEFCKAFNNPISLKDAGALLSDNDIADRLQIIEVALSLSLTDEAYSFTDHTALHEAIVVLFTPEEVPLVTYLQLKIYPLKINLH